MNRIIVAIAIVMAVCFTITSVTICKVNSRIAEYEKEVNAAISDIEKEIQRIDNNSVDMKGFVKYVEAHR